MRFLRIAKLSEHQHYKDRRPPWIKLHAKILDDYRFACLQDASKAHLMLLWVLASQTDNKIPYDLVWITRKLGAQEPVDVEELILQGFIEVFEDDSAPLASRKQKNRPETETETEKKDPARTARGEKSGFDLGPYLDAHRTAFPGSVPPAGRFGKVFKRLESVHGPPETLRRWRICLAKKSTFATPEELASHWSEYATENGVGVDASKAIVDEWGQLTEYGERITRPDHVKKNPFQ